jgi:hypothetical protein
MTLLFMRLFFKLSESNGGKASLILFAWVGAIIGTSGWRIILSII